MSWWRRLGQNRLLGVGALVIAVLAAVKIAVVLPLQASRPDFANQYVWSRLLLEGTNPYIEPLQSQYERLGFVYDETTPASTYPPTLLWLFAPFASLETHVAFVCWVEVEIASLIGILWLTVLLLGDRLSARGRWFFYMGVLASTAVYLHFVYSQVQLLLAALILLAYRWRRDGKRTEATLAITIAGLLKLFPFLLLPWFVWGGRDAPKGRWKRLGLAAGLSTIVVLATGVPLWRDFFVHGRRVLGAWTMRHVMNFSMPSLVAHWGYAMQGFEPSLAAERVWWGIGLATGLALLVAAYWLCACSCDDSEAQFCLLSATMLAGHVAVWGHYFVFLIFPMAAAAARIAANPTGSRIVWFGLIWIAMNVLDTWTAPLFEHHLLVKLLLNYVPLYGLLALTVFFAKELRAGWREQELHRL